MEFEIKDFGDMGIWFVNMEKTYSEMTFAAQLCQQQIFEKKKKNIKIVVGIGM